MSEGSDPNGAEAIESAAAGPKAAGVNEVRSEAVGPNEAVGSNRAGSISIEGESWLLFSRALNECRPVSGINSQHDTGKAIGMQPLTQSRQLWYP